MLTTIIIWVGLAVTFFIGRKRWHEFPKERLAFILFSMLTAGVSLIYGLNLSLFFVIDMLNHWFSPVSGMVLK